MAKGLTKVLSSEEATALLAGMDVSTLVGLRDRALIAVMTYTFARVGAVVALTVEDYYSQKKRWWLRLHEKNDKVNEMLCHHKLEAYLDEYIRKAGIAEDRKGRCSNPRLARRASYRTGPCCAGMCRAWCGSGRFVVAPDYAFVFEKRLAPGPLQCRQLHGGVLIIGRDAGIAVFHACIMGQQNGTLQGLLLLLAVFVPKLTLLRNGHRAAGVQDAAEAWRLLSPIGSSSATARLPSRRAPRRQYVTSVREQAQSGCCDDLAVASPLPARRQTWPDPLRRA